VLCYSNEKDYMFIKNNIRMRYRSETECFAAVQLHFQGIYHFSVLRRISASSLFPVLVDVINISLFYMLDCCKLLQHFFSRIMLHLRDHSCNRYRTKKGSFSNG
jgi:hypothetical protein